MAGLRRDDRQSEETDLSFLRNSPLLPTLAITADLIAVIVVVTDGVGVQGGRAIAVVFGLVAFALGAGYLWLAQVRSRPQKQLAWVAVVVGLVAAGVGLINSNAGPLQGNAVNAGSASSNSATQTPTTSAWSAPKSFDSSAPEETASTTSASTSRPPIEVELSALSPVVADFGYDTRTVRMLGATYTQGVQYRATSSEERTVEYDLGGRFSAIAGLVGLDDETPNSNAVAHFRFIDERGAVLYKAEGTLGKPARLGNLKVNGVLRLKIAYMVTDMRPNYLINDLDVTLAGVVLHP